MKLFLIGIIISLAAAVPLASAQTETLVVEPFIGGGLSVGIPYGSIGLSLQGGADNVIGGLGLRGVFNFGFESGASLAADIINYFPETRRLAPYVGAGMEVSLGVLAYGPHGIGGLEYFVDEDVALFAELQPTYLIIPDAGSFVNVSVHLGANYHFD